MLSSNCRCAWVPANVGEDDEDQTRSKSDIDDALDEAGLDITVGRDRPRSILNRVADVLAAPEWFDVDL